MKQPLHSFANRLTRRILLLWILMMSTIAAIVDPELMVHALDEAVHAFVGPAEQSDDLTMLAIRFLGKPL